MGIRAVHEIPQNVSEKRQSYRASIREDLRQAMEQGISKFEFTGDYNYKYLAQYAREEASRLMRELLQEIIPLLRKQYGEKAACFLPSHAPTFFNIFTVHAYKDKEHDTTRVFCEVEMSREELEQAIRKEVESRIAKPEAQTAGKN